MTSDLQYHVIQQATKSGRVDYERPATDATTETGE